MNDHKKTHRSLYAALALALILLPLAAQRNSVVRVRVSDLPDYSRIVLEFSSPLSSNVEKSGSLILVKIRADGEIRLQRPGFNSRLIESLSWARGADYFMLSIQVKTADFRYEAFTVQNPSQLVIDVTADAPSPSRAVPPPGKKERRGEAASPERPSSGRAPLSGRRTVIIDPGHGGLQTGSRGRGGTLEKDLTLQISRRLKAIIERNLTFNVDMTRDKDIDVSLEGRAAKANNTEADLFISIHVNGSYRKDANGSETYFLSLNATDEEARRLAYLENNSEEFEEALQGSSDDAIKMILWDMAQNAYLKQSSQLAESIQRELNALLGTRNRGIRQAPFKVLTGVACPAVLVEVAFLTNPEEEGQLKKEEFQERVAQAIYRGLVNFINTYSND